ncbi:MAG: hypothetical protein LBR74_05215 [Eubacterium sp.]|jgi:FtsZ-binding cell division protein ZapB|nr:hypothetical protein [Eubacterium sp.]
MAVSKDAIKKLSSDSTFEKTAFGTEMMGFKKSEVNMYISVLKKKNNDLLKKVEEFQAEVERLEHVQESIAEITSSYEGRLAKMNDQLALAKTAIESSQKKCDLLQQELDRLKSGGGLTEVSQMELASDAVDDYKNENGCSVKSTDENINGYGLDFQNNSDNLSGTNEFEDIFGRIPNDFNANDPAKDNSMIINKDENLSPLESNTVNKGKDLPPLESHKLEKGNDFLPENPLKFEKGADLSDDLFLVNPNGGVYCSPNDGGTLENLGFTGEQGVSNDKNSEFAVKTEDSGDMDYKFDFYEELIK